MLEVKESGCFGRLGIRDSGKFGMRETGNQGIWEIWNEGIRGITQITVNCPLIAH